MGAILFGGLAIAPLPKSLSLPPSPIPVSTPINKVDRPLLFERAAIAPPPKSLPLPPTLPISTSTPINKVDRPLHLSVTVEDPSFLRIRVGDTIKPGDILADNVKERSRLNLQKQSISLQISRLKDKVIIAPLPPRKILPIKPLPPANYSEELAAISQAKLRIEHAKSILISRSPWLKQFDDSTYKQLQSKVDQQVQLLASMKDLKMEPEVSQHEEAVLKQMQQEAKKAEAEFNQNKGKQLQELQQLHVNVELAESELQQKQAALDAARARRKLQEFESSRDAIRIVQQEEQIALEHSRQIALYNQQQRDKDYQLAELDVRKHQVEDKLADLPIVRSPKAGYIKRIKPWVGRDGKYTTTLIIAGLAVNLSGSSSGSGSQVTSPPQVTQKGVKVSPSPSASATSSK